MQKRQNYEPKSAQQQQSDFSLQNIGTNSSAHESSNSPQTRTILALIESCRVTLILLVQDSKIGKIIFENYIFTQLYKMIFFEHSCL